jgi:CRP/FNR family transcriptional regulator, cyclic AMP receptor protein
VKLSERFQGETGRRLLMEALQSQFIVRGQDSVAAAFASVATIEEFDPGDLLIRQGDADNDLLLILAGRVVVLVNGRQVASRGPGQHVGEICAIDPISRRTATNVAAEATVVARISEPDLSMIAEAHPQLWRAVAVELSRRLDQRSQFHPEPNPTPVLFLGSSKETLLVAEAVGKSIPTDVASVRLWAQGVFGASRFPIEDLDAQLRVADFAALIAGADDRVSSRGKDFDAPRDNVIFELGLFMGALSRHRTFLVVSDGIDLKVPSDLLGLTLVRYNPKAPTLAASVAGACDELIAVIRAKGSK